MATNIRSATVSDIASLEIVRRQAVESNFSGVYQRNDFADLVAFESTSLENWIESDQYIALVMETDITPVCYGVVDLAEGQILALYTAPEYEREGRARTVLSQLEEYVLTNSSNREVEAVVPIPAIDFFKEMDYQIGDEDTWEGLEARQCRKIL